MPVVAALVSIFKGLAAIPAIMEYCKEFAAQIALWYIQSQNDATISAIADAAAFAANAQTDEERYAAAEKWREALSRPRYSN
jgi:hypothetical protein